MISFYEKERVEALDLQRQFADRAILALWGGGSSSTNYTRRGTDSGFTPPAAGSSATIGWT